jgi:hypothetical protein
VGNILALFSKEGGSAEPGDLSAAPQSRVICLQLSQLPCSSENCQVYCVTDTLKSLINIKVNNDHLPVKLQRIVSKKFIPEAVFVPRSIIAQLFCKAFQFLVLWKHSITCGDSLPNT